MGREGDGATQPDTFIRCPNTEKWVEKRVASRYIGVHKIKKIKPLIGESRSA